MKTCPHHSQKLKPNTSRRWQELSCITQEQSTPLSLPHSLIATEQAKPMQETMKKVKQLVDYCATQEDVIITYNASQMILAIQSDDRYCNEKNAHSQAGGHFFLSNDEKFPPNSGTILTNATIIKAVMSSAAKAEPRALFLNAKEVVYFHQILSKMGHPQPWMAI
jgi:hypothetical protein